MDIFKNKIVLKNFIKNRESIMFSVLFIFFAAFPILPFKVKGGFVVLFILTAFFSLKTKTKKLNYFYLINGFLYIIYLLSLSYSYNISRGVSLLETTLSIFIFPVAFVFFSGDRKASKFFLKRESFLKHLFIVFSFLLSILIFLVSLEFGNYITEKINLGLFMLKLNTGFYWLEDHPIYLSMYLSISLLMIFNIFNKSKKKVKVFLIIIGFFEFFVLAILSKKGVIISFFLSTFIYLIVSAKSKKKVLVITIVIVTLSSLFMYKYVPDTVKRFKEVFDSKSYKKIESYSSTSIRYGVYKCAFYKISNSLLIGYGLGDVKDELNKCYKKVSNVLIKGEYNSHNQYLGILLYVGVFGLLVFLVSLLINLNLFYIGKDYFAFSLLLMFMLFMLTENILDRQNGVILFSFFLNYYSFKNTNLL